MTMMGVTEGRIVHYVLPVDSLSPEAHRPAIIVKVWNVSGRGEPDYASVNLQVFTDFTNDFAGQRGTDGHLWATSVLYDPDKKPGTWHWIEPA